MHTQETSALMGYLAKELSDISEDAMRYLQLSTPSEKLMSMSIQQLLGLAQEYQAVVHALKRAGTSAFERREVERLEWSALGYYHPNVKVLKDVVRNGHLKGVKLDDVECSVDGYVSSIKYAPKPWWAIPTVVHALKAHAFLAYQGHRQFLMPIPDGATDMRPCAWIKPFDDRYWNIVTANCDGDAGDMSFVDWLPEGAGVDTNPIDKHLVPELQKLQRTCSPLILVRILSQGRKFYTSVDGQHELTSLIQSYEDRYRKVYSDVSYQINDTEHALESIVAAALRTRLGDGSLDVDVTYDDDDDEVIVTFNSMIDSIEDRYRAVRVRIQEAVDRKQASMMIGVDEINACNGLDDQDPIGHADTIDQAIERVCSDNASLRISFLPAMHASASTPPAYTLHFSYNN